MLQKTDNAFFQDGFKVLYQDLDTVTIKAGLGFQSSATTTKEPVKKPLYLSADVNQNINTPDSSNPRIDIISVKWNREDSETENRKVKDEFTDEVSNEDLTVSTDWKADILYTAGTPAGSPVAPATPVGYIKIATIAVAASTGIASQSSITDNRSPLPFCTSTSVTGSQEWDAVVGDISQLGVTHEDLKSALDNAEDGWKILVLQDETVDTTPVVLNNDVEVHFKRGVTFTRGASTIGLQVDGNDCKIVNARLKDFSTGGDNGIKVSVGALRTVMDTPRFKDCAATKINDLGTQTYVNVEFTE